MHVMRIFQSRPLVRWLAPLALVAAVGTTGVVAVTASADRKLPTRTAEELLVDLQQAKVDGLSGTVVQRAELGLPAIPGAGGQDSTEFTSLVSGSHTLRVAYSSPDKMRVALLANFGESDIIRNGNDVWLWSSRENTATHRTLTDKDQPTPMPSDAPKTPEEAAQRVLAALEPDTTVSTASDVTVADRAAYELVLDPDAPGTLISKVRIAIDGETKAPLRVQVFGKDDVLAFEVGFTTVSFERPDDAEFQFNPPPGAEVTEQSGEPKHPNADERAEAEKARDQVKTVGTGWTSVAIASAVKTPSADNQQLTAFLEQLPKVSGSWGSGRVLSGTAFSAVLTDDGRVAVGAVTPEVLYEALSK